MVLKDIPADARPREKLLANGAGSLADAELIALLLRTGLKGTSVLQLAQQMLDRFGGIQGLLHASADDLKQVYSVLSKQLVMETKELEITSFFAGLAAILMLTAAGLSLAWFGRVL